MSLNPRQKRFAELYHRYGNATQAYLEAYPDSGEEAARRSASDLLTNPDIVEAITQLEKGAELQCTLTREELLTRLAAIIDAKPNEAASDNPLCELVMTKMGPASLFPSKLGAMKELARITGMNAPQKVEVSADSEVVEMLRGLTGAKE